MPSDGQRLTPLEMLAKLVSFDTESSKSNLPLIGFLEGYLRSWNVPFVRMQNATGDKVAIYATIGAQDRGGVVLSGHTDVVPVAGQAWSSDPFVMTRRDGKLYGRGTADMKGFIATALALVPELVGRALPEPVHLALSFDEEVGCVGVHHLLADLAGAG